MRARNPGDSSNPVVDYGGILKFAEIKDFPRGRFAISNGGMPIDFFHDYVGSDTTVVVFHGAIPKSATLPLLAGQGIVGKLGVNRISVSDPTLTLNKELLLAWFAGNHIQNDVQGLIRRVIRIVTKLSGAKHLVFLGGSGGGYAALDMSRRFPGSLALPMNPQTSIGHHEQRKIDLYLRSAWPEAESVADLPTKTAHNQVAAYAEGFDNTVGYIQNVRDARHIRMHFRPFVEAVGHDKNVMVFSGRWGDPEGSAHVPPPKPILRDILRTVATSQGNWNSALTGTGFTISSKSPLVSFRPRVP